MAQGIHWEAIALRLILTVIAGGILGAERSKSGHPAGLRTTLLVTLAASIAMIQVNLLMPTNGKPSDSFVTMDLMRLPLGILTGVGFIGAGAIVRKGEMVLGITTAATLWFATVVGLCMGGGQLILGSVSAALGFIVLSVLRRFESAMERYQVAELEMTVAEGRFSAEALRARLQAARFHIKSLSVSFNVNEHCKEFRCEVRWPAVAGSAELPAILADFEVLPGLIKMEWRGTSLNKN